MSIICNSIKTIEKSPTISIITVSFNALNSIEETILSVINQFYTNIEYIIIDGGSTDGTVDIIKRYEKNIAYWSSETDKGIYDAMNKGIKQATGDFLFFLGADDVLLVDLSIMAKKMHDDTIYYGFIKLKNRNSVYLSRFSKYTLSRRNVSHQAIFYPRLVFLAYNYDIKYKLYADWLLNMQCLFLKIPIEFVNTPIVLYNDLGESSCNFDELFLIDQSFNIKKYLGKGPFLLYKILSCCKKYAASQNIFADIYSRLKK